MSKVFLAGFLAGKKRYEQLFDSESLEVLLYELDGMAPIYLVNEGGWVYNKHGAIAGRFQLSDNKTWHYASVDGSVRMNTKFTDIMEAERNVFMRLLTFGYVE
jgi:hypothetical protein